MKKKLQKSIQKNQIIKNPDKFAMQICEKGIYSFGNGLTLRVSEKLKKSWIGRIQRKDLKKVFGLGPYPKVSYRDALNKFIEIQKNIDLGIEVISVRDERIKIPKFKDFAIEYFENKRSGFLNYKHQQQWENTLKVYAFPFIGDKLVSEIIEEDILRLLKPIYLSKHETARRVLQRIGRILNAAKVRKLRKYDINTKGIVDSLPKYNGKVVHYRALPYTEAPKVINLLKSQKPTIPVLAIQAIIFTCVRSGELRGAKWSEIDFENKQWVIPSGRMKKKIEHCVPLSEPAIQVFKLAKDLYGEKGSEYVFFGLNSRKPITDAALSKTQKNLNIDSTIHGWRSCFRDACDELFEADSDLAEMALAHARKNKVEAAYRRGTRFAKRLELMNKWAEYCTKDI